MQKSVFQTLMRRQHVLLVQHNFFRHSSQVSSKTILLENDEFKIKRNYNILSKPLKFKSKVPPLPIRSEFSHVQLPESTSIDDKTIELLERLSLVNLDNKEAIATLEDAIRFADKIVNINTDGIEPLYTVLEDSNLELREDQVTDGNYRKDILSNAQLTEEDYFVAPPGNIPIETREDLLHTKQK